MIELNEAQRCILVSIFRKTVRMNAGQAVRWVPDEELPKVPLSILARSLRELEDMKLIIRLPQKQVKLTGLGLQFAIAVTERTKS